jgi:hypothetical protein
VRKNALRHGLASITMAVSVSGAQVSVIVESLVGVCDNPGIREAAERFALAHLTWMQTETVRQKVIKQKLKIYHYNESSRGNDDVVLARVLSDPEVIAIDRYERRAFNQRRRAAQALGF